MSYERYAHLIKKITLEKSWKIVRALVFSRRSERPSIRIILLQQATQKSR